VEPSGRPVGTKIGKLLHAEQNLPYAYIRNFMRYRTLILLWLVSDIALFVAAFCLAYFLRVGWIFSSDFPFEHFLTSVLIVAPIWLLVLATTRTFSLTRSQSTMRNAAYITYSALVGVSLFTLAYYFNYEQFFSRILLIMAFVLSAAGVWAWHIAYSILMRNILRSDPAEFPTLIVGVTRESARLIRKLNESHHPLMPVAILDGKGTKETEIEGVPVRGKLNKLEDILESERITHLIQCSDLEQSLNLLSACRQRGCTYLLLPSVLGIVERDERVDTLEGQPVTIVSPKEHWWTWFFR
jgi:FlaA1/EpsC-like NDP-sugar epimerase